VVEVEDSTEVLEADSKPLEVAVEDGYGKRADRPLFLRRLLPGQFQPLSTYNAVLILLQHS
jgi:hypothetical protein